MTKLLSRAIAVLAVVLTGAGCDSKREPYDDAIGNATLIILLDPVARHVTVRNTGESKFVNCGVGVDKPSERGGVGVATPSGGENHTALMDAVVFGGNWLEVNTTGMAVLRPGESMDIPLSTFGAYRDGSLFGGPSSPWAYAVCRDDKTSKDTRVTASF